MKYPEEITPEILRRLAHIPDAEIASDIADTEAEITDMVASLEMIGEMPEPMSGSVARIIDVRARALRDGIAERRHFVTYLRRVQEARGA